VRQRRSLRTLRDGSPENKPPACVTEPVWSPGFNLSGNALGRVALLMLFLSQ